MLKALQMNDPLVLRLGAKVDMSAPKPASNPAPLDVDLTVKWVGDVLDEAVQESDMAHPACWDRLPWNPPASLTEADVNALIEKIWLDVSARPGFFVDPARGVDFAAVTTFKDGQLTTRAIPSRDMYEPPDAVAPYLSGDQGDETATGMWLRIQAAERKNRAMREAVDRMQIVPGSAWRWQP